MRWSLIAADRPRARKIGKFLFHLFQPRTKPSKLLLLFKEFVMEVSNGLVLHGRERFELYNTFFHAESIADRSGLGSCFSVFCVEAWLAFF